MTTQPLYDAPRVGGDILSWCTKCKMELAHVVVSMVDTKPKRVICKTCKSEHNHRGTSAPAPKRASKTGTRKAAAPRTTVRASEYFDQKLAEKKSTATQPYAVTKMYAAGDVIEHSRFGVGIVEDIKQGGKMTVLFREGERILVFGMAGGAPTRDASPGPG